VPFVSSGLSLILKFALDLRRGSSGSNRRLSVVFVVLMSASVVVAVAVAFAIAVSVVVAVAVAVAVTVAAAFVTAPLEVCITRVAVRLAS